MRPVSRGPTHLIGLRMLSCGTGFTEHVSVNDDTHGFFTDPWMIHARSTTQRGARERQ